MKNITITILSRIFTVASIATATFLLIPYFANAEGASGWFAPRVEYVGPVASHCSGDQASIELSLVEYGTQNTISNSIGSWSVTIRDNVSSMNRIGGENYNGQKQSNALCFNPERNGIQVSVARSGSYHEFNGPAIYPSGSGLDAMRGGHFRGYVELAPRSLSPHDVAAVQPPSGAAISDDTDFIVRTNRMPSRYSANSLHLIRLYIANSSGLVSESVVPVTGSAGNYAISGVPSSLGSGLYYWTFNKEYSGTAQTNIDGTSFTFRNLPASGAPERAGSFLIDNNAPEVRFGSFSILGYVPNSTSFVQGKVDFSARDRFSGLQSATLYLTDSTGRVIASVPFDYSEPYPTSRQTIETIFELRVGQRYGFFLQAVDGAGNQAQTEIEYVDIPSNFSVPEVEVLLDDSNWYHHWSSKEFRIRVYGEVLDNGGMLVQRYGSCYSENISDLEPANIMSGGAVCRETENTSYLSLPYQFRDTHYDVPTFTTLYFRTFAENDTGIGYSSAVGEVEIPPTLQDTWDEPEPTVPDVGARASSDGADEVRYRVRVNDNGGRLISHFGLCFTDDPDVDPLDLVRVHSEIYEESEDYTATSWTPYTWLSDDESSGCRIRSGRRLQNYRGTFYWTRFTIPETRHYMASFAVNDIGMGSATDRTDTPARRTTFSVDDVTLDGGFNRNNNTFYLEAEFRAVNRSNYRLREEGTFQLPYEVNVYTSVGATYTYNDEATIDAYPDGSLRYWSGQQGESPRRHNQSGIISTPLFSDLPEGTTRITIEVNQPTKFEETIPSDNYSRVLEFRIPPVGTEFDFSDALVGGDEGEGDIDVTPPPGDPTVSVWGQLSGGGDNQYQDSANITPANDVTIHWEVTEGSDAETTTCEATGALDDPVASSGGSQPVDINSFTLGETLSFGVRCQSSNSAGASDWSSDSVQLHMLNLALLLEHDPAFVRTGETTEVSWDVEVDASSGISGPTVSVAEEPLYDYQLSCNIRGATTADNLEISFTQDNYTSSITSNPLFNAFETRIQCDVTTNGVLGDTLEDIHRVEVIPAPREN